MLPTRRPLWMALYGLGLLLALLLPGCTSGPRVMSYVDDLENPPKQLSAWGLFKGDMKQHQPNDGVLPYDVATPLFSDYALKYRAVWLPPGTTAEAKDNGVFAFPVGTVLLKTFAYPYSDGSRRLIETRLLVKGEAGWEAIPYVWNEDQSDAKLSLVGTSTQIDWSHQSGRKYSFTYVVPNSNECKNCHQLTDALKPLGPKASQLNWKYEYKDGAQNQLDRWIKVGFLKESAALRSAPTMPNWRDPKAGTVTQRARAYLDANCGHCHQPDAPASNSALYLNFETTDPGDLGVCKHPVAAGKGSGDLRYSVVPGKPDRSILLFRMLSDVSEIRMPELGRVVAHQEGIELIRAWIQQMKGTCPDEP